MTITELELGVLSDNKAPITLAQGVYMGDGTSDTVKDKIQTILGEEYDFKFKTSEGGSTYTGLCLTYAPQFGYWNKTENNTIEISMKIKLLTKDATISFGIHESTILGLRYDTNMSVKGGSSKKFIKGEISELSYTTNTWGAIKPNLTLIFKYNTVGIEFEIYDLSFKINGVEARYYENNQYLATNIDYECVVNKTFKDIEYNLETITRDLLCATDDTPEKILLWGDSITAGDKATSTDKCYASLLMNNLTTYYKCTAQNLAVSGRFLGQWKGDLSAVSALTSILIFQIGTNDTSTISETPESFRDYINNLKELINTFKIRGVKVIIMCATPCSVNWINNGSRTKFEWIHRAIVSVSLETSIPLIDNHDDILEYCELKGEDYNTYLFDGVHPNDKGYEWIYKNIIKKLKLRKIPDATW